VSSAPNEMRTRLLPHPPRTDFANRFLKFFSVDRFCVVFTALHGMQTRSYDEISVRLSVRPSVRPSVCQTRAL